MQQDTRRRIYEIHSQYVRVGDLPGVETAQISTKTLRGNAQYVPQESDEYEKIVRLRELAC